MVLPLGGAMVIDPMDLMCNHHLTPTRGDIETVNRNLNGAENLEEFAAGATSNNPHYGAVHNPWKLDCVPGGSSGGSGANVAACVTFASLGTDLGGSVRLPGAFC